MIKFDIKDEASLAIVGAWLVKHLEDTAAIITPINKVRVLLAKAADDKLDEGYCTGYQDAFDDLVDDLKDYILSVGGTKTIEVPNDSK